MTIPVELVGLLCLVFSGFSYTAAHIVRKEGGYVSKFWIGFVTEPFIATVWLMIGLFLVFGGA